MSSGLQVLTSEVWLDHALVGRNSDQRAADNLRNDTHYITSWTDGGFSKSDVPQL